MSNAFMINRDLWNDLWDDRIRSGDLKGPNSRDKYLVEFIKQRREEMGKQLLDIGCGTGRNYIPLVEEGFDVTGLDISPVGLQILKEQLEEKRLSAKLVMGKSSELPFDSDSFDFVLAHGSLHFGTWNEIENNFAEVWRVMRPKRYFLFEVRSRNDATKITQRMDDKGYTAIDFTGLLMHFFTKEELLELAKENRFDIAMGPIENSRPRRPPMGDKFQWYVVFRKA